MEKGTTQISADQMRQVADWQAAMQNSAIMRSIVAEMKEIPELPSEVPKEVHPLIKVEFPDQGGILSYMEGYDQPYKGFPFFEFVDKIDFMKKTQKSVLSSFFHSLKRNRWKVILLPFLLEDIARAFIYTFYRQIERFRVKPKMYCDAIRELHRAFTEKGNAQDVTMMIRDIVCSLLEFDNAYRYRFQDVIVELNKDNLRKNPRKEIIRLLDLMVSRELTQEVRDTWSLARKFLPLYLLVNRSASKTITEILENIDLEKMTLTVEDRFYCNSRKDYKFGYMN